MVHRLRCPSSLVRLRECSSSCRAQQIAFQRMLDTIRRGFERFGFLPVETPVFELTDVLLTKSGGETEKQVYFVQSTGALEQGDTPELALRFDLTVPLARYVAEHEHELNFPFRRYQIQRVYRGERAQKRPVPRVLPVRHRRDRQGHAAARVRRRAAGGDLRHLQRARRSAPFTIYINNRKLLRGLLEALGIADRAAGRGAARGRSARQAASVREIAAAARGDGRAPTREAKLLDSADARLAGRRDRRARRARGSSGERDFKQGLAELERGLRRHARARRARVGAAVNLSIVRGLDYYTGTVYETFLDEHPRARLDLLGRPLREPRRALHEVEAARRRHLDRRDAAVLAAASSSA